VDLAIDDSQKETNIKRLIRVASVVVISTVVAAIVVAVERPAERRIKPCVAITGSDSHVRMPQYYQVASHETWARLWQEHKGERVTDEYDSYEDRLALPVIDFDNYVVIVIFQGEGWNSKGLSLLSLSEDTKRVVLRYGDKSYQTIGKAHKVATYGFFVLPRYEKPIVVEENVQVYAGEPAVWKEHPLTSGKLRREKEGTGGKGQGYCAIMGNLV
jgi:hypothetical protein